MKPWAFLVALLAMTVASSASAQTWAIGAGWSYTSLGRPQPDGYGTTGGNTALVSARRTVLNAALALDASIVGRAYGFEQDGARTVGVELDGGIIARRGILSLGTNKASVWAGASIGGYRSPFATAIGRLRWIGIRPSFDIGLSVLAKDGWTVDASLNLRRYDVLVWQGWSVGASVLGGWSW